MGTFADKRLYIAEARYEAHGKITYFLSRRDALVSRISSITQVPEASFSDAALSLRVFVYARFTV